MTFHANPRQPDPRWCCCNCDHHPTTRVRAAWLWYHGIGNISPLCDPCFHGWMRNAAEDPDMAPVRYHARSSASES